MQSFCSLWHQPLRYGLFLSQRCGGDERNGKPLQQFQLKRFFYGSALLQLMDRKVSADVEYKGKATAGAYGFEILRRKRKWT